MVVWSDYRNGTGDIYGTRVTPDGTVLDTGGIAISTAANNQLYPDVVFDGANFLVVWSDYRNGNASDIYGARVTSQGTVLDTIGIAISAGIDNEVQPVLAFDGDYSLVVWQRSQGHSRVDLYCTRVTPDGTVSERKPVGGSEGDQLGPALARGLGNTLFLVYQGWTGSVGGRAYNAWRIWGGAGADDAIAELTKLDARKVVGPTIVRGAVFLPGSASPSCLLDVSGREVMDLMPGANDVRVLAPGVYFVRSEPPAVAVRKVVVTR